jgi:hypothetical protein
MKKVLRPAIALLLCANLLACGGGGGDDSPPPPSRPALTFEPQALVANTDPGVTTTATLVARPTFSTSSTVYVLVSDPVGVITTGIQITPQSDGSYNTRLTISPKLTAGHYTGHIQVLVCPVADCSQQFAGSPVMLPYDITVGSPTNLTPLVRDDNVPEWGTYQGGAAHTGYVPGVLDASRFNVRWRWVSGDTGSQVSPPVVSNDSVYVTTSGYFAGVSRLHALREQDASTSWSHSFGAVFTVNPPAVFNGAVYAATSGHSDTAMWAFNATDGALRFRTPFNSQWEHYYAPTLVGDMVYTNGGSYGGLQAFNTSTGLAAWFTSLQQYDQWTPAVDDTHAYANVGGALTTMDRRTGTVVNTTPLNGFAWNSWSSYSVPVLAGGGRVLMRSGGGYNFNSPTNALNLVRPLDGGIAWSVTGSFATDPVVAGEVFFVGNLAPMQLAARSLANGNVLWSWPLADSSDTGFVGNLAATDSHVFLSTNWKTYAIHRTTRQAEWSHPRAGHKIISPNRVLYISTMNEGASDGGLTAINLR